MDRQDRNVGRMEIQVGKTSTFYVVFAAGQVMIVHQKEET